MRRWLVALVALASFGVGWIVNDVTECRSSTTGGIYSDGDSTPGMCH